MNNHKIRLGITHGDINGIGYEVIFKTFADPAMLELCTPILYGSPKVAAYHRKALGLEANFSIIHSVDEAQEGRLNLLSLFDEELKIELGRATPESGHAAFVALEAAVRDYKQGLLEGIVTAPINKHAIQSAEFPFVGHTEYFEQCVGDGARALMILMDEHLRVALVTTHLPLKNVAAAITRDAVLGKLRIFYRALSVDLRIAAPRIAVLSLNPHGGDEGLLGSEERDEIVPAIEAASSEGIPTFGPYAADGFFGAAHYRHFDGVLAMYHDQGLAPFKALSMSGGVNFTAGLPLVRTSPDHGTAYDLAGRGVADAQSFRSAVYAAIDICRNRAAYAEAAANPLQSQPRITSRERRATTHPESLAAGEAAQTPAPQSTDEA